jgi:hypothetical protein
MKRKKEFETARDVIQPVFQIFSITHDLRCDHKLLHPISTFTLKCSIFLKNRPEHTHNNDSTVDGSHKPQTNQSIECSHQEGTNMGHHGRNRRRNRGSKKRGRSLEHCFKVVSLVVTAAVVLWNVYLFGHLSATVNHHGNDNTALEPTFSLGHQEACVDVKVPTKDDNDSLKVPTGLVVTVLSFDEHNPQLWNSICTLFPSQLTLFIVPHQLDVFLLLYGNHKNTNIERDLVDCMQLQPSLSHANTTWHNSDGSVLTTRNYYATTVIAGTRYKTTVKIAIQPDMDMPTYITRETTNLTLYLQDHPIVPPMCKAPIEYMQGTRWYTNQLLHLQLLEKYDYWIKLDPDIVFVDPLPLNLLYDMQRRGAVFAHTGEYPVGAPTSCSEGIGRAVEAYLHTTASCAIPNQKLPDRDRYYTNLIIGRVDVFQSEGVRNFGRWLSEYPEGFFRHRWTDQIFFHAALQLYVWDYPKFVVDYTDFRCAPVRDCWMTSLDLKEYAQSDVCQNKGSFVHTKHSLHWVHRWNRYYARKPYDLTQQRQANIHQSSYRHDCRGTRWRGGGGGGVKRKHPFIQ